MKLPGLLVKFEDLGLAQEKDNVHVWHSWRNRNLGHQYNDYIEKIDESVVAFDQVTLEKKISSIVPDVIAQKGNKTCLLEIAVTHFVDEEKKKKIEELGFAAIEIDMSEYIHSEITREELHDILMNRTGKKSWVFNPKREKLLAMAEEKVKLILDEQKEWIRKNIERVENIKKEDRRKAQEKIRKRAEGIKVIKEALIPENYARIIESLKSDDLALNTYSSRWMSKQQKSIPFYLNIPICGEMIFKCDRRVWQTLLFEQFVYNRKTTSISQDKIEAWLKHHQSVIKVDWRYAYKVYNELNRKEYHFFKDVIEQYFYYLDCLGFISINNGFDGFFGEVMAPHSLTPPNKEYARSLELALQQVSELSPSVDEDIAKIVRRQMAVIKK